MIVPGNSEKSRLMVAVSRTDPELMMPPEGEGQPLTAEEVGLVRAWIDQGAKWPDAASVKGGEHWAYKKPVRAEVPRSESRSQVVGREMRLTVSFSRGWSRRDCSLRRSWIGRG